MKTGNTLPKTYGRILLLFVPLLFVCHMLRADDSPAAAANMAAGTAYTGSVFHIYNNPTPPNTPGDDIDYIKTLLPAQGTLKIYLQATYTSFVGNGNGSPSATYSFRTYNRNLTQLTSYSIPAIANGATRFDTITIHCYQADSIYFQVDLGSGDGTIDYNIQYEIIAPTYDGDIEPNATMVTATGINMSESKQGNIGYVSGQNFSDAMDYYKTLLPYDGTLKVYLEARSTMPGNSSYYVHIYNKQGSQQLSSGFITVNAAAVKYDTMTLHCRAADSIFFRVTETSNCISYKIRYEVIAPTHNDDGESNNSFAEAIPIMAGETREGHVGYEYTDNGTDVADFYKTLLPADGTVKIYLEAKSTEAGTSNYYVHLFNRSKTQELTSGFLPLGQGLTRYDTLYLYCREADSLYFKINETSNCVSYKIRYEMVLPVNTNDTGDNGSFATATPINASETKQGHIGYEDGVNGSDAQDYYKTLLPGRGTVRIYLEAVATAPGGSNYYLHVHNKAKSQIATSGFLPLSQGVLRRDTMTLYCLATDSFYFKVNETSNCVSYKIRYEIMLGNDITTFQCPGYTVDLTQLYDLGAFNSIQWTKMSSSPTPAATAADTGVYRLIVEKTGQACSKDTAMITVLLNPNVDVYYADGDGDGFGNANVFIYACSLPAGYVTDSNDCDDTHNTVHPGAVEQCGNNIDDDCDGQTDEGCCLPCTKAPKKPSLLMTGLSSIGTTNKFCPGDTVTMSVKIAEPTTCYYNWTAPTGATIISGQGTSSVKVLLDAGYTVAANVSVIATNTCGTALPAVKKITRGTKAKTPGIITGEKYGVCEQLNVPYEVLNTPGINYNWFFDGVNAGAYAASVQSGQGTNAITVNYTNSWVTGVVNVTAANACGVSTARKLTAIKPIPENPSIITGPDTVCISQMGVPYSTPPLFGAATYTWTAPVGSTINDGVSTSAGNTMTTTHHSVTINFGTKKGTLKVVANNSCGSSGGKTKTVVTTNCSVPRIETKAEGLSLYPNPAADELNLDFYSARSLSVTIKVYDMLGKEILMNTFSATEGNNQASVDVSNLPAGVYQLILENGSMQYKARFVKE